MGKIYALFSHSLLGTIDKTAPSRYSGPRNPDNSLSYTLLEN